MNTPANEIGGEQLTWQQEQHENLVVWASTGVAICFLAGTVKLMEHLGITIPA